MGHSRATAHAMDRHYLGCKYVVSLPGAWWPLYCWRHIFWPRLARLHASFSCCRPLPMGRLAPGSLSGSVCHSCGVYVLCMPQRQPACLVVGALECGCSFIVIIALCVCTCNFELNVLCQKFIKLIDFRGRGMALVGIFFIVQYCGKMRHNTNNHCCHR